MRSPKKYDIFTLHPCARYTDNACNISKVVYHASLTTVDPLVHLTRWIISVIITTTFHFKLYFPKRSTVLKGFDLSCEACPRNFKRVYMHSSFSLKCEIDNVHRVRGVLCHDYLFIYLSILFICPSTL